MVHSLTTRLRQALKMRGQNKQLFLQKNANCPIQQIWPIINKTNEHDVIEASLPIKQELRKAYFFLENRLDVVDAVLQHPSVVHPSTNCHTISPSLTLSLAPSFHHSSSPPCCSTTSTASINFTCISRAASMVGNDRKKSSA